MENLNQQWRSFGQRTFFCIFWAKFFRRNDYFGKSRIRVDTCLDSSLSKFVQLNYVHYLYFKYFMKKLVASQAPP